MLLTSLFIVLNILKEKEMKKLIFLLLTAVFVFALSSCEAQKKQNKDQQKEKHEKRW